MIAWGTPCPRSIATTDHPVHDPSRTERLTMKYPGLLPYALCCIALATSCKDGGAPELTDPGDQVAVVGMQLQVHLYASDPEGDSIDFSFSSSAPDLSTTAAMTIAP